MQGEDIVCLITADNPSQAHLIQEALAEEGIDCRVVGEYLEAGFGDLPGTKPELWIHRRDLERAEKVLAEHTPRTAAEEPSD